MTPRAFLEYSTRLVCEATGADPEVVRERLAQSVTVLAIEGLEPELSLAPPVLPRCCDYGGACDCDEDAPTRAELEAADGEEYAREASRMAWAR